MNPNNETTNSTINSREELLQRISVALSARQAMLVLQNINKHCACSTDFTKAARGLVVDLFASTLVVINHARPPDPLRICPRCFCLLSRSPPLAHEWIAQTPVCHKIPHCEGASPPLVICSQASSQNMACAMLDLTLNQDCSFYLDTHNLRKYLIQNMAGKSVLNCFAYTGALGIAALAGGARNVVQTDLNKAALTLAQQSIQFNSSPAAWKRSRWISSRR